jgi:hypothetical protein
MMKATSRNTDEKFVRNSQVPELTSRARVSQPRVTSFDVKAPRI